MTILSTFKDFYNDPFSDYMYVTGAAGTGKTTELRETVQYCIDNEINYIVSAYTHKALGILKKKMPAGTKLKTLHSYLEKFPTINENARVEEEVSQNSTSNSEQSAKILFIDEFSMVGEVDFQDLKGKVVFIGDPNQLPPVKDKPGVVPCLPYWVKLTKVYRQADDNPLLDTLTHLAARIKGKPAEPIHPHKTLIQCPDLASEYHKHEDSILLSYRNASVQKYNRLIEGKEVLEVGDKIFSPTNQQTGTVGEDFYGKNRIENVQCIRGEDEKWRKSNLKVLATLDIKILQIDPDDEEESVCRAVIFGHSDYKNYSKRLIDEALAANKALRNAYNLPLDENLTEWCKTHKNPLQEVRGKAWKKYYIFNDYVLCVDFIHATTIHKSQGSTYSTVLFDTAYLKNDAGEGSTYYHKLLYTAMSRASKQVFFK